MTEPRFLEVDQVHRLHRLLIDRFGGTHGTRDDGLVEAAVMQPRHTHYYAGGDLFDLAAGYVFHIAEAQAFLDGNKRAGMASALVFLESNGVPIPESTEALYEAMIAIAEKRLGKPQLAALIRRLAGTGG